MGRKSNKMKAIENGYGYNELLTPEQNEQIERDMARNDLDADKILELDEKELDAMEALYPEIEKEIAELEKEIAELDAIQAQEDAAFEAELQKRLEAEEYEAMAQMASVA